MKLAEDAAAALAEDRQERDPEPCRCRPLCGPSPFELRTAARRRELDAATFAQALGGAA